jgi:hypothetical protein
MKKFKGSALGLVLVLSMALIAPSVYAQTSSNVPVTSPLISRQYGTLAATGGQAVLYERGYGIGTHMLYWTGVSGTRTTCTVKLEQSATGAFGGEESDLIAAQDCTTDGRAIITKSFANYVRVKVTVISGAGNTIAVSYKGFDDAQPVLRQLCDSSGVPFAINTASATTIRPVAPVTNQSIYICGYQIVSAGATNVTLEQGTGGTCGTGTTVLTGAMTTAAGTNITPSSGLPIKVPASKEFCYVNSAGVQISGYVTLLGPI